MKIVGWKSSFNFRTEVITANYIATRTLTATELCTTECDCVAVRATGVSRVFECSIFEVTKIPPSNIVLK